MVVMILITAERTVSAFSPETPPIASVTLNQSFRCQTLDCYSEQIHSEDILRPGIDMNRFNPATGPIYVEGVRAGETVEIFVESVELSDHGVMAVSPGLGVLGNQVNEPHTRILPIHGNKIDFGHEVMVHVEPMIGVLGVTPSSTRISTEYPGTHGGNLDTTLLRSGASLILQAQVDGALIAVGDLHALQGDGELGGTGVETSGEVQLRVRKVLSYGKLPKITTDDSLYILSSAASVDRATEAGFDEAVQLLAELHNLPWIDAYRLASVVCNLEVSQIVNPHVTVRIRIPTTWCEEAVTRGE
jgi:amidase